MTPIFHLTQLADIGAISRHPSSSRTIVVHQEENNVTTNERPLRRVIGNREVEWHTPSGIHSTTIQRLSCGHELRQSKPGATRRRCLKCEPVREMRRA